MEADGGRFTASIFQWVHPRLVLHHSNRFGGSCSGHKLPGGVKVRKEEVKGKTCQGEDGVSGRGVKRPSGGGMFSKLSLPSVSPPDTVRDTFLIDPAIILIVVGVVMFFITFCGCIGALRENIRLLKTVIIMKDTLKTSAVMCCCCCCC